MTSKELREQLLASAKSEWIAIIESFRREAADEARWEEHDRLMVAFNEAYGHANGAAYEIESIMEKARRPK